VVHSSQNELVRNTRQIKEQQKSFMKKSLARAGWQPAVNAKVIELPGSNSAATATKERLRNTWMPQEITVVILSYTY
jgi:hypothetical protein